jgi:hypothetical protein
VNQDHDISGSDPILFFRAGPFHCRRACSRCRVVSCRIVPDVESQLKLFVISLSLFLSRLLSIHALTDSICLSNHPSYLTCGHHPLYADPIHWDVTLHHISHHSIQHASLGLASLTKRFVRFNCLLRSFYDFSIHLQPGRRSSSESIVGDPWSVSQLRPLSSSNPPHAPGSVFLLSACPYFAGLSTAS